MQAIKPIEPPPRIEQRLLDLRNNSGITGEEETHRTKTEDGVLRDVDGHTTTEISSVHPD